MTYSAVSIVGHGRKLNILKILFSSFITLFHKDGTLNFIDKAMIERKIPITAGQGVRHYCRVHYGTLLIAITRLFGIVRTKKFNFC